MNLPAFGARLRSIATGPVGATLVAAGLVRVAGFTRQVVLARVFGVSAEYDMYLAAAVVPLFLSNVIGVAFNTALLPFLVRSRQNGERAEVGALRKAVRLSTLGSGSAAAAILLLAPVIVATVAPHLAENPDAVITARLGAGLVIISVLTEVLIAANLSRRKFAIAAIAPIAIPLIVGGAALAFGPNAPMLMAATLIGHSITLGIVALPLLGFSRKSASQVVAAFPWREVAAMTVSVLASGTAVAIDRALAGRIGPGALSVLEIGTRVQESLEGLLGVVIGNVAATALAVRATKEPHHEYIRRTLRQGLSIGTAMILPVAVLIWWTPDIVEVLFVGGRLAPEAAREVITVQRTALLRIPFYLMTLLFVRSLNATNQSWSVARIMATFAVLSVCGDLLLIPRFGVSGIPLATAVAYAMVTWPFVYAVGRTA